MKEKKSPKDFSDLNQAEWKSILSPEEYRILREKGTEAPWSGQFP